MASVSKIASVTSRVIEPSLQEFIDEVLVPMLVRDAVRDMRSQIHVAPRTVAVAQSESERDIS
jgi:hypothetical protein